VENLLRCSKCKKYKSPDDFYFEKNAISHGQRGRYCKECDSAYHTKYVEQHRERINSREREYRKERKRVGNPLPNPNHLLANGGICAYAGCTSKRVSKGYSYCLEHYRLLSRKWAKERRDRKRETAKQAHAAGTFPRPPRKSEILINYLEYIYQQALQISEQGQVKPVL
jgi:hypothetical protein